MSDIQYEIVKRFDNVSEPYSIIATRFAVGDSLPISRLIGSYSSYGKACIALKKIDLLDGDCTNYSFYLPCKLVNLIDERCRVLGSKRSRSAVLQEILVEYFCDLCPDTSEPLDL